MLLANAILVAQSSPTADGAIVKEISFSRSLVRSETEGGGWPSEFRRRYG